MLFIYKYCNKMLVNKTKFGFSCPCRYFAKPYVGDTMQFAVGLNDIPSLWIQDKPCIQGVFVSDAHH